MRLDPRLALLIAGTLSGCAFFDGPVGIFAGGPLTSGALVDEREVDWSFAREVESIELESAGRSRTTRIIALGSEGFVPANPDFPPFKTWHERALASPEAVVRIDGRRYRATLERVENDPELAQELFDRVQEKYGGGPSKSPEEAWYFRLAPRASD
ncbi:MAG: hypothetical protein AAF430_06270 [Myxococcota bacterium]